MPYGDKVRILIAIVVRPCLLLLYGGFSGVRVYYQFAIGRFGRRQR